jgi:cytochrome c oxidase assembly protein subunit 15
MTVADLDERMQASRASDANGRTEVSLWLWFVAVLIFAMVIVGGATRLTDSGLSITEWQPILGAFPPSGEADWLSAFEKYRQIPQYSIVNQGMSLDKFKFIYWWEWSHRLLGRLIGIAFALPLLYFWLRSRLKPGTGAKFVGILALGGIQGVIGWYMVKSGLSDRIDVSQYRLALHLTTAFAILALVVWLALEEWPRAVSAAGAAATPAIKRLSAALVALVLIQVVLGAFVAGLKAGLVYNTWPTMNGQWFPSDYWTKPAYLSFFESHAAAQFNHRLMAYVVGLAALAEVWLVLRAPSDKRVRVTAIALLCAVFAQMALGIATLLAHVPLGLGLLHQGGGAVVLVLAILHLHATHRTAVNVGVPA